MPSFAYRSDQTELLDEKNIPFEAIRQNMKELNKINHFLGGHRITLQGFKELIKNKAQKEWHVLEIGCGGGDNLRVIRDWAERHQINVHLTGIDMNPECIAYAQTVPENAGIYFIISDYRDVILEQPTHIIFSSLFCHHFSQDQLKGQLEWMHKHATHGFFINDLHRHPLAYYSIKWLTTFLSRSELVKNDAPISVLRGFRKTELIDLMKASAMKDVQILWRWAFRWLIVCKK